MSALVDNATKLFISASGAPGNFGATIYNALFALHGINAVYLPRKAENAAELARALRTLDIKGCSVTSPLKTEIIAQLDEVDALAKKLNSVNTVVNTNSKLKGYNTDYIGLESVLKALSPGEALIYGAGSVTATAVYALKACGWKSISLCARDAMKAKAAAQKYGVSALALADAVKKKFSLVVNCTPASKETSGDLYKLLDATDTAFDLVVSPTDTPWIAAARAKGRQIITGVAMCKFQLQQQFEIYTGLSPHLDEIEKIVQDLYVKTGSR